MGNNSMKNASKMTKNREKYRFRRNIAWKWEKIGNKKESKWNFVKVARRKLPVSITNWSWILPTLFYFLRLFCSLKAANYFTYVYPTRALTESWLILAVPKPRISQICRFWKRNGFLYKKEYDFSFSRKKNLLKFEKGFCESKKSKHKVLLTAF